MPVDDPANDLVDVLEALHDEKEHVLRAQLTSIQAEIAEREVIAADRILIIHDDLRDVRCQLLNLTHGEENLPDVDRRDRLAFEQVRLMLTRELREEQRDTWRDVLMLRREQRDVRRELSLNDQRRARTADLE